MMFLRPISRCLRPGLLSFSTAPSSLSQKPPVLAIRREEKNWERRAPLNPNHVQTLVRSGVKVLLQPSTRRSYSMQEYEAAGAILSENISEADLIMCMKEVPVSEFIEDKTYLFYSHTIKAQKDNMPMLDAILKKGIRLIDYENMLDEDGQRFVQGPSSGFAGTVGMIDIMYGLGLRFLALGHHTPFMHVGMAHNYPTLSGAKAAIASLGREIQYGLLPESLGPLIFTFTGSGAVSKGAQEVFRELPHEYVPPSSLKEVMETGDSRKVYATVVRRWDYLERRDGGGFDSNEFETNPEQYVSTFAEKIAPYTTCLINGLFYAPGNPRIITKEQCRRLHPLEMDATQLNFQGIPKLPQRMLAISDVSCDIGGSLEFMTVCTTLDNPFVIYDAHNDMMSDDMTGNGIVICSIDHMPTELGREATDQFGNTVLPFVHQFLKIDGKKPLQDVDVSQTVKDSVIAFNGSLTEKYQYIEDLRRKLGH